MKDEANTGPFVLLIIPDWQTRALIHAQLVEDGYEVGTAPSLDRALKWLLRGLWPDVAVVLLDLRDETPDEQLARKLGALRSLAPVMALTGPFGPNRDALTRMGVQAILSRPVTVGQVTAALRQLVAPGVG